MQHSNSQPPNSPHSVAVIGSGPAGMGAALYLAREGLSVTVYEDKVFGGLLPQIGSLENYPGFSGSGQDLATALRTQAESFGAKFSYGACESVATSTHGVALTIDEAEISADAVIIATGCAPKKLTLPGVPPDKISYCALCDAPLYKGKSVLVIGGGNSALQESLHIAEFASQITLINRSKFRASPTLIEKVQNHPQITPIEATDPTEFVKNHQFDGYFVFIGFQPSTDFLPTEVIENGYIITDQRSMTTLTGVFAAGSVRLGTTNQVITGVADGAHTAISVANYLKKH